MRTDLEPYIGVTGISEIEEAKRITESFIKEDLATKGGGRRGMIGLLASQKTLSSGDQLRIKYPNLERIRQIFEATGGHAFNTLHYHTYQVAGVTEQLDELLSRNGLYADKLCEGVQLNISSPPPNEVEKTRVKFPDLKIILQLGPRMLTENGPITIAENLAPYIELVHYVLIDPSGGRGRVFKVNTIAPVYNQIRDKYPDVSMVFAGGFDGGNVRRRLWLLKQTVGTDNFSIDAEGGLRVQQVNIQPPAPFSISRARRYIHNASVFFRTGSAI